MGTRNGARFFLVTEHGVAEINARSQDRFVRALCSVAHPDFRDDLAKAAWEELRVRV
jgi:acyl-CoA hydrolase